MRVLGILKKIFLLVLFFSLSGYLIFAMTRMSSPDPEEKCESLMLLMDDDASTNFITKSDVMSLLKSAGIYPVGKAMIDVSSRKIEDVLAKNPFIGKVECYKTPDKRICVSIAQRTPIMFVIPEAGDSYFIDGEGSVIPPINYPENLVVATGNISRKYAVEHLVSIGKFLQSNKFWNNQIEQIHVSLDREHYRVLELVPRVGDQIIYLGRINGYEKKLKRLKIFYERAMKEVGWNKYSRINLEYDNQIICKKNKHVQ